MFILNIYTFRCLALPWLIFSMLEILILGCPAVIFFSLLGIYLYIQVNFKCSASTCISRYTSYLYLASTCIFSYTSILGIYLYIQVHIYTWHLTCIIRHSSILGIYLDIQVHHCTRLLPMYPGTHIYSELPVFPGTHLYLASTCIFK